MYEEFKPGFATQEVEQKNISRCDNDEYQQEQCCNHILAWSINVFCAHITAWCCCKSQKCLLAQFITFDQVELVTFNSSCFFEELEKHLQHSSLQASAILLWSAIDFMDNPTIRHSR